MIDIGFIDTRSMNGRTRYGLPWRRILPFAGLAALGIGLWLAVRPVPPDFHVLDVRAMQMAATLLKEGRREEALDLVERRLTENPGSLELGNFYRASAVSVKLHDRPIRFLIGLTDSLPSPPDGLRYNLAFAYIDKIPVVGPMGAGFLSKRAIKQFQTVLDKEPDNWIANYGIGMNYLHWPEYFEKNDDSMHYFEKCIEIQSRTPKRPYYVLTFIRLGDAYAKVGRVEKAREAWQAGLKDFPGFSDLTSRLALNDGETVSIIKDMYNPNNSIGEINTDVSILWAEQLPASTLPLKRMVIANGERGIGGQFVAEKADTSDARYFAWFEKNLPLLLHRSEAGKVDMKGLGATEANDSRGMSLIASDMVRGFMTQFQEEDPATTKKMLDQAAPFDRPFLHEGIGMGLAADLDTEGDGSLAAFKDRIAAFDPAFHRLHYAGLGMWYGLSPTVNLVRIRKQFADLSLQAQIYAYEGLGFAVSLFHHGGNAKGLEVAERLPFAAASAFAHGAGRAMWVKFGGDTNALKESLAGLSDRLWPDALSGFGMGVGFTRINHPEDFFTVGDSVSRATGRACTDFLTGLAMGLGIRDVTDRSYVDQSLAGAPSADLAHEARRLREISLNALQTMREAQVEELHGNWRKAIRDGIEGLHATPTADHPCQVPA
jgi:tetratricopeptide (TPR) repeat protein